MRLKLRRHYPGPLALSTTSRVTQAGIPISTINQGAGKLNLLIGVPENRYEEAISAIYTAIE